MYVSLMYASLMYGVLFSAKPGGMAQRVFHHRSNLCTRDNHLRHSCIWRAPRLGKRKG